MKKAIFLATTFFFVSLFLVTTKAAAIPKNENYDLTKIEASAKKSQAIQGLITRPEAAIIAGARGHAALLPTLASNLQNMPDIANLLAQHKISPNFPLFAEPLFSIKQDNGLITTDNKQISNLEVTSSATALLPTLKQALEQGALEPTRLGLLARLGQSEKETLAAIEKKLPNALTPPASAASAAEISISKEVGKLEAIALSRKTMDALWFNSNEANIPKLIRDMQKAIALDAENPVHLYLLAESYLRGGKSPQATDVLSRALKLDSNFVEALTLRGTIYFGLQLTTQAINDFDMLIEKNADNSSYYLGRGSSRLIEKKFDNMCQDFKRACELGDCIGYTWAKKRSYCP